VNLIADRSRFAIDLRVGEAGAEMHCRPGHHVVYTPTSDSRVDVDGRAYTLAKDHALRLCTSAETTVVVQEGQILLGSVHDRRQDRTSASSRSVRLASEPTCAFLR
jgi:hypothetical protein